MRLSLLTFCMYCLLRGQSGPPPVIHWCGQHCTTLVLENGHYGKPETSLWTVERWTPELIVIYRTDRLPNGRGEARAVLRAIVDRGNETAKGTMKWWMGWTGGVDFRMAWGSAINSVPGSDAELNAQKAAESRQPPAQASAESNAYAAAGRGEGVAAMPKAINHPEAGGTVPFFRPEKTFTYDLAGEWKLVFPPNMRRPSLVLIDLTQKGKHIQMVADSPNQFYPFEKVMFVGTYGENVITGDWMNVPAHRDANGDYDGTRIDIRILSATNLITPAGIRVTRSDELGANKSCDAVAYAHMDQARTFIYGSRDFELGNYGNAACWIYVAASQGHHEAQRELAVFLHLGLGVEKNDGQSFAWMQRSATAGNKAAQSLLARYYDKGIGVTTDPVQARLWMGRAKDGTPEPDLPETPEQAIVGLVKMVQTAVCSGLGGPNDARIAMYKGRGMSEAEAQRASRDDDFDTSLLCPPH